jgi:hypothetical protein
VNRVAKPPSAREAVGDHIRWAEGTASSVLPPGDREEIHRLCTLLAERSADRPLSVGVFGQFSSGKSTLLNALLGAGLLPSAARVTTGVATRLRPARSDGLAVMLGETGETLSFGSAAFSAWYESAVGSAEPSDIRVVLREIMRSPRAAKSLDRIDLGLAGAVLGPDVIVIDTPGFDATDAGHHEITERVAGEVDLAIVLIPANSPGAMSLGRFLQEVLADLSDRCVFVLTKFRQVPAAERADLQEHIASWLEELGFPEATVIRADATDIAVALRDGRPDAATPEFPADAALAETRDIARRLRTLAADRRQQLIEATLKVLLGRLLSSVTQAAQERREVLHEMRERLDGVQIVDLRQFLRHWRTALAGEIEESSWRSVTRERSADGPEDELAEARDEAVGKLGALTGVPEIVADLLSETERILGEWTEKAVRRAAKDCAKDLGKHADRLQEAFTTQYADLAALSGANPQPPSFERSLPPITLPGLDLSDAFEPLRAAGQELRTEGYLKSGGGMVAGATIGTAILPGIGTVIGGVVGLMAGSGRGRQREKLRGYAEAMHAQSLEAAKDAIAQCEPALREVLDDAADALVARYMASAGPVIEQLTADYNARVARLEAELSRVLAVLSEASRRHAVLNERGLGSEE